MIAALALAVSRWLVALALAPLLLGIINRVKAFFAGRDGQPLLQPYRDLVKLLGKGVVISHTTSWVFRAGPAVCLAAVAIALAMMPLGGPAILAFPGDFIVFAYLLGLARFLTVLAALDTGSAFEGMGASREVAFSALAEPALLVAFGALVRLSGQELASLSTILGSVTTRSWLTAGPSLALVAAAFAVVLLAENARIPFDDPTTHLELTMIHEVMVLDHSGPDFAFILFGVSLKLWAFAALLAAVAAPAHTGSALLDGATAVGAVFIVAIAVGVVESSMARLRLVRVPQLLVGASVAAALALLLVR